MLHSLKENTVHINHSHMVDIVIIETKVAKRYKTLKNYST